MTLLFTGYPGFIGTALLPRVLARHADERVVCLVQPHHRDQAEQHLAELPDHLAARVATVDGDITRPGLGLCGDDLPRDDLTEVWHLAAVYDLSVDRAVARRVNVDGTRHVLDLASSAPALRRLHHVSTCYVSGRYPGMFAEDDLVAAQPFNNHYEATKFLAEVAVRDRMRQGLPATVYRPAVVVGDCATGATQKYDGPYYLVRWLLRQPRLAVVPVVADPRRIRFTMIPRDTLVDAMDHLSGLDASVGRTYALADPDPPTVAGMLDVLAAVTGQRIAKVPVPLRPTRNAIDRVGWLRRFVGFPGVALDYFAHPTTYDTTHARRDLAGSGIRVPQFASYAAAIVDFTERNPDIPAQAMT
ncbi:MAG TPA: SDR family oxidoreductase [Micromonosporaceae bacterium]